MTNDNQTMSQEELNNQWARLREEREQFEQRDREVEDMRRELMLIREQLAAQRIEHQQELERHRIERDQQQHIGKVLV